VSVYSKLGRGTTFKVYLPRTDEAEEARRTAARAPRAAGGRETVLLVEDEDMVRDFVSKVLTRHGYTVHALPDPSSAIDFAAAHRGPIQLIVTDVVLPKMSGRVMATEVMVDHPEARVLYTSGYTDESIVHHGVLEPGMWFLQKPFTADALLTKLRALMDGQLTVA
jgi:two-component system, cell cycle sensor histidine kinase and response regulator CckA